MHAASHIAGIAVHRAKHRLLPDRLRESKPLDTPDCMAAMSHCKANRMEGKSPCEAQAVASLQGRAN